MQDDEEYETKDDRIIPYSFHDQNSSGLVYFHNTGVRNLEGAEDDTGTDGIKVLDEYQAKVPPAELDITQDTELQQSIWDRLPLKNNDRAELFKWLCEEQAKADALQEQKTKNEKKRKIEAAA